MPMKSVRKLLPIQKRLKMTSIIPPQFFCGCVGVCVCKGITRLGRRKPDDLNFLFQGEISGMTSTKVLWERKCSRRRSKNLKRYVHYQSGGMIDSEV